MQQKKVIVSGIFCIVSFVRAMEQEIPQVSTAVTVAQEESSPNPLLKEFFVKSGLQENFDQAQFYKSHPNMFGAKTDLPKTLPILIPDVCKTVLSHLSPDYTYTKIALGFVALPEKPDVYGLSDGGAEQMPLCSNLNNLKMVKMIYSGKEGNPSGKDVLALFGDTNCNFDIQLHHSSSSVRFDDDYAGKESTYDWDDIFSNKDEDVVGHIIHRDSILGYDGVNRFGNAVVYLKRNKFFVLNIDNPFQKEVSESWVVDRNNNNEIKSKKTVFHVPGYVSPYLKMGDLSAMGLHYASNRVGICSFDNVTDTANICVYDFNAALFSNDDNQLVTWQGKLPEEFRKCIFVTGSTLLGITMDGKLYSMALKKDNTISVHRQVLKDLEKKDLLIKKIAVDFMNPRRVVFVATEKENLYLMDLKSEKKIFVKIQDRILQNSVERLWCGDGKIGMKYTKEQLRIQQFDYIPC